MEQPDVFQVWPQAVIGTVLAAQADGVACIVLAVTAMFLSVSIPVLPVVADTA